MKALNLLFVLLAIFVFDTAFSHQKKSAETTVLFNKQSNKLEVMHRFYLHDTEHAVQKLFNKKADILDSKQTQQQFAKYVSQQFFARDLSEQALILNNVGYEVDGKFFWVYQEANLPENIQGIKLFNGTLRNLWPTQVNMVNIEGKGKVRTLYFSHHKNWLIAKF
ncbi:hypothetical protein PAUR_a1549 [Pseudoalteromonas aurantia 208]|uniref:Orphan protein n=1 Tax=Pseudoalteromonas aurantia 208 TaxID=1314867 RepID=A0ABR9EAM1_9GAMM|nr:DUF6702 family protein [Pseudoalteromonas aurantia]MBE0368037.1 hypothetical protein [Pseudoalteromonas aurantia 208]